MDETGLLHALKDTATEIMDLNARVGALEKKMAISTGLIEDVCNCPNCDGSCYEEVQDEQ